MNIHTVKLADKTDLFSRNFHSKLVVQLCEFDKYFILNILYLLERMPRRLLNFLTCRCGIYLRAMLIWRRRLFKTAYL